MADDGGNNNIVSSSSSKRRLLMIDDDGNNNNRSSSVHQVVFNDDLLIEILLRLPFPSLLFFKSVSKHWLSVITSPAFFNLRLTRFPNMPPPSGLFLQHPILQMPMRFQHDFVSLDSRIPWGKKKKKSSAFTFGCFGTDASNVEVLQSCNGLFLCVIRTNPPDRFYVYNPTINMFKMLPPVDGVELNSNSDKMRFAFDPDKSPHYKVLHFRMLWRPQRSIQTRIYFSETGCWRIGGTFPPTWFCRNFDMGVYWNDAIHWLDLMHRVRHFKLYLEHPRHKTTYLSKTWDRHRCTYKLFESRGCLLLACARNTHPKELEIYEMRNGYSRWSSKYIVKYVDSSIPAFTKTWRKSTEGFRFNVLSIVLGEREEEPFVVMEIFGKVVKYNLLSKTLHVLCDIDTTLTEFVLCDIDTTLTEFGTFPFIASFAAV